MSVTEGQSRRLGTTAAMWDDSEDDESSDDSAYTESDGSEPEMIEYLLTDSDMMDATRYFLREISEPDGSGAADRMISLKGIYDKDSSTGNDGIL